MGSTHVRMQHGCTGFRSGLLKPSGTLQLYRSTPSSQFSHSSFTTLPAACHHKHELCCYA